MDFKGINSSDWSIPFPEIPDFFPTYNEKSIKIFLPTALGYACGSQSNGVLKIEVNPTNNAGRKKTPPIFNSMINLEVFLDGKKIEEVKEVEASQLYRLPDGSFQFNYRIKDYNPHNVRVVITKLGFQIQETNTNFQISKSAPCSTSFTSFSNNRLALNLSSPSANRLWRG